MEEFVVVMTSRESKRTRQMEKRKIDCLIKREGVFGVDVSKSSYNQG